MVVGQLFDSTLESGILRENARIYVRNALVDPQPQLWLSNMQECMNLQGSQTQTPTCARISLRLVLS
jgi:hypothetical protein